MVNVPYFTLTLNLGSLISTNHSSIWPQAVEITNKLFTKFFHYSKDENLFKNIVSLELGSSRIFRLLFKALHKLLFGLNHFYNAEYLSQNSFQYLNLA